jgi:hypothetical protein
LQPLLTSSVVPDNLLAGLDSRDVSVWLGGIPAGDGFSVSDVARFLTLPWKQVFSESSDPALLTAIEQIGSEGSLIRRRGFIHIIESDPARIPLPPRSLPIYLLKGRALGSTKFEDQLRRMTMQEELRRSHVRHLIVVSGSNDPVIPSELKDLWAAGFRPYLTFVSDRIDALEVLSEWLAEAGVGPSVTLLEQSAAHAVREIFDRYTAVYPDARIVVRVREQSGAIHRIDITEIDDPERPILDHYEIIEDRHLTPIVPEELREHEFNEFFQAQHLSWRPFAAGLPWIRNDRWQARLFGLLHRLDDAGSSENCIAYVAAESGAGGTTLARFLAWESARAGYPTLLAKPLAFVPDALPVANFLTRVNQLSVDTSTPKQKGGNDSRYETPWVIVFDRLHFDHNAGELRRFRNEIERSGRSACIIVVTSSQKELEYYDVSVFKPIAELNHLLSEHEAYELGRHLNKFLRVYGKERPEWQWKAFYDAHTVRYLEGIAAFWITLSFWIQAQYDLSESIQEWIYRAFKERVDLPELRLPLLEIAALSSERLPLPEGLLPLAGRSWPVSLLLEDRRPQLASLGLIRFTTAKEKHWALVHDLLGRFLINALFHDFPIRKELGFEGARNAEHLRFLVLRGVSQKPVLGELEYRSIGEEFATSIFKIDPDHGRISFASIWREVLLALDRMPPSLRDSSRVFRHHTSISRRRIALLDSVAYDIGPSDRVELLERAIADIEYALGEIDYAPGGESDLNLYNSLANAYMNLAEVRDSQGASTEEVAQLRSKANSATRRAYEESPTNPFVVETYIKNLLLEASRGSPERAAELCVEVLEIIYSALRSDDKAFRPSHLARLADRAFDLLLKQSPTREASTEPQSPVDVLVRAWTILAAAPSSSDESLLDIPKGSLVAALKVLGHPAGRGNLQVLRLSYQLLAAAEPFAFTQQLDLLEQLHVTDYRLTPQLRLEYALLLYQRGRAVEADAQFRKLRALWRESEHFVRVPDRLRWLRRGDTQALATVRAVAASDYGYRAMAKVRELRDVQVPYRPEEFGVRDYRPGTLFTALVSFGHNGPFLKPSTAQPNHPA